MESSFSVLALKALDGLAARAAVIAQNIANAGTPAYRPLRLTFEQALIKAAGLGDEAVRKVSPLLERTSAIGAEGSLRLDLEMETASSTALRYAALIDILDRKMQLDTLAVKGSF